MTTNTLDNYQVLFNEDLVQIGGGYSGRDCLKAYGASIVSGAAGGAMWGLPAGGVGAVPGAVVGAHVGAIGGGLVCIGGFLGN